MITEPKARAKYLNNLIGRPYELGTSGPNEFDCYGICRHLQDVFWGREMPLFEAPAQAGRFGLAAMIAAHPERANWREISKPKDGALVTMAKQGMGYHMGTFIDIDGGIICHAIETDGVTIDRAFALGALGWRRLQYHLPI